MERRNKIEICTLFFTIFKKYPFWKTDCFFCSHTFNYQKLKQSNDILLKFTRFSKQNFQRIVFQMWSLCFIDTCVQITLPPIFLQMHKVREKARGSLDITHSEFCGRSEMRCEKSMSDRCHNNKISVVTACTVLCIAIRYHSRIFDCLAHPKLSAALATDQQWPLSCLRIS